MKFIYPSITRNYCIVLNANVTWLLNNGWQWHCRQFNCFQTTLLFAQTALSRTSLLFTQSIYVLIKWIEMRWLCLSWKSLNWAKLNFLGQDVMGHYLSHMSLLLRIYIIIASLFSILLSTVEKRFCVEIY